MEALDLSGLDTSQVTNMGDMFFACSLFRSLDLSPLDTSRESRQFNFLLLFFL